MKWYWVISLMSLAWFIGVLWAGFFADVRKMKKKVFDIEEKTEEIIQVAIDHVDCRHRTEGDADYDIDKEGTRKIREILGGML